MSARKGPAIPLGGQRRWQNIGDKVNGAAFDSAHGDILHAERAASGITMQASGLDTRTSV
jgi:hypothetical protein